MSIDEKRLLGLSEADFRSQKTTVANPQRLTDLKVQSRRNKKVSSMKLVALVAVTVPVALGHQGVLVVGKTFLAASTDPTEGSTAWSPVPTSKILRDLIFYFLTVCVGRSKLIILV